MPCTHCGARTILARGLCGACYHRLRKTGSVARKNVQNIGPCNVPGCEEPARAKGFCNFHYDQQRHPLTHTWKLIRSRYPDMVPPEWAKFETFLACVGERPSPRHQLRRVDDSKPYSADNVRWTAPIGPPSTKPSSKTPEERADYARKWTLRRKYGLSAEQYGAMLEEQGGVCGICEGAVDFINPNAGKAPVLGVDHDHRTNRVRGLLCVKCNRMLGYARDDTEILRRAIAYLERHRKG